MAEVAVITRTKNRPLLLARAFKSIAGQHFKNLVWVLVNDGGNPSPVDEIAEKAMEKGIEILVLHHDSSRGMEAASNAGIQASASRYIAIHDDDDTWEPAFLSRCLNVLNIGPILPDVRGIVTRTTRIQEHLESDGSIVEIDREPYNNELETVTLFEMAHLDRIPPPISFVFERVALDTVGLFREDLPVLGDWEFNLRFLSQFNIEVVTEFLANYHVRESAFDSNYKNTVTGAISDHVRYVAYLRNALLREDMASGRFGVGCLINISHDFNRVLKRLNCLVARKGGQ